jgi:transposase
MQVDPEYRIRLPRLDSVAGLQAAIGYETADPNELQRERVASVRRLAARLSLVLMHADGLARQIKTLAAIRFTPLTEVWGISLLTAGTLAGVLGPGRRFRTDAQLAAYAGAAPLEASSAGLVRHRLNRGGNRRLNAVLYRIVLTQAHHSEGGRAYLDRRVSEGKTRREAMRALKRYIVRAIWRLWQLCQPIGTASIARRAA